jgi:two-component system phosphate regulon sensor histidine kinase PhoR
LIGISRQFLKPRTSLEGRLRLVVVMVLLGLPLAIGVWAFAEASGRNARDRADAQLSAVVRSALQVYTGSLDTAQAKAASTAARRDVQVALARRDRRTLERIATAEGLSFELPAGAASIGGGRQQAATRSVEVVVGRRHVGRVVAVVGLDDALLRRLGKTIALPAGDRLVFRPGLAASQPASVRLGSADYRAAAARLEGGRSPSSLLALAPAARIEASADRARNRVLLAGLVSLGCLGLLLYAFAPVVARGRMLRAQRDQAARVLNHLGEGVFLVDDDGVVRLWNPSAETITGLGSAAVTGRPVAEAISGWDGLSERIPVGGERPQAATLAVELRGRERWLSISGARFSEGTVYAFRDLTEERRLEQMRSDFVATVSHELRTPLASIHGAVLTLSKRRAELEPALHDRLLGIVVGQSERLSELVEQILLAAQLDSGGLQFAAAPFDGDGLARTVIEAAQPRVPTGVTVRLTSPGAVDALGDAGRARLVLSNLLDNAVKYSPDGGQIDVVVARGAHGVRFTVRDEGLGIPPDEQERIFEKFYRLDASMNRGVGGSGLGLYICSELVRGMGGRIWVTSAPGSGSAFSFELPFGERQAATA